MSLEQATRFEGVNEEVTIDCIRVAENLVSKVEAISYLKTALDLSKSILENLQIYREVSSAKYGRERLICVATPSERHHFQATKTNAILLALKKCIKSCDGIIARERINALLYIFCGSRKMGISKNIRQVHRLVRSLELQSLVLVSNDAVADVEKNVSNEDISYSPLQLFRKLYMNGSVFILDKPFECGTRADVHRGLWEAEHGDRRHVAVKVKRTSAHSLEKERLFDEELWKECRLWMKLKHKFILDFLGIHLTRKSDGEIGLGIITPLCNKGTSTEYFRFADYNKITYGFRLDFIRKIAEAIRYLHECGIVHADIKPSNVLVKDDRDPAICDFGTAQFVQAQMLTIPLGTANYMPPETVRDVGRFLARHPGEPPIVMTPVTFAVDVWAFGMTALELLTGRRPYCQYPTEIMVFGHILAGEMPVRPDIVAIDVWDALAQCWVSDPKVRPPILRLKEILDAIVLEDDLDNLVDASVSTGLQDPDDS